MLSKLSQTILIFLTVCFIVTGFSSISVPAPAQVAGNIPTTTYQNATIPDFNKITFDSLPAFSQPGQVTFPSSIVSQIGYDPSRSWNALSSVSQVSMLGDFSDLNPQSLTANQIGRILGFNPSNTSLASFGLVGKQTIASLVTAISGLSNQPVASVKPIADAVSSSNAGYIDNTETIGQLLTDNPDFGNTSLSQLPLNQYKINDIPGLADTTFGSFQNWESANISQVPGLSQLPWSNFPDPIQLNGGAVGTMDVPFEYKEQNRQRTISGSDKDGFNVPCTGDCASFEVGGVPGITGTYWISGKPPAPWVNGGHGILGAIGGGKEPHGRLPFGNTFKMVVSDQSEAKGTVDFSFYTRFCKQTLFVDFGCTPYIIGPIPFVQGVPEKQWVYLGAVNMPSAQATNAQNQPVIASQIPPTTNPSSNSLLADNQLNNQATPATSSPELSYLQTVQPNCNNQAAGIAVDAVENAIASINGGYSTIGAYGCDANGDCDRPLGIGQFRSSSPDVENAILAKDGGQAFLNQVNSGQAISADQLLNFFSSADQKKLMDNLVSQMITLAEQQTDPATGQLFSGTRLIQRAAQMYFGGAAIPVDANITGSNGTTVQAFGESVASRYQSFLTQMGCA